MVEARTVRMDRLTVIRRLETVIVRGLLFLQSVLTASRAHPTSYLVGIPGFFFSVGLCRRDARVTTHLQLVPKFRMSGALIPIPYYAIMVCSGTR